MPVRQANLAAQRRALNLLGVDQTMRLYAVWCADAESDFENITHPGAVGANHSEGLYGQTSPWWPNDHFDIMAATASFVRAAEPVIRRTSGNIVQDLWDIQNWNAPDWRDDPAGFVASVETQNYIGREARVRALSAGGALTE